MQKTFNKIIQGYTQFREKYASHNNDLMQKLSKHGQSPEIMVVSCCDSRVDPALLLQCDPGDLFVVRNIANIVPPYEHDNKHHGTSAALEYGVNYLEVKHLIILGHSQCGGINAALNKDELESDFINHWVDLIEINNASCDDVDCCAKESLINSYNNALTFPWIKEKVEQGKLKIHMWFFAINAGLIYAYDHDGKQFKPLGVAEI